jgi:hypothetical protein
VAGLMKSLTALKERRFEWIAGHKMTTTLVSVQETDVPDSDFAIPSDYPVQEMKMPAIPAKPTDG